MHPFLILANKISGYNTPKINPLTTVKFGLKIAFQKRKREP